MPRRNILTDRQRAALFDLPSDEPSLLRHYTLSDEDLDHISEGLPASAGSPSLRVLKYSPNALRCADNVTHRTVP